jgi:hypothetical protein
VLALASWGLRGRRFGAAGVRAAACAAYAIYLSIYPSIYLSIYLGMQGLAGGDTQACSLFLAGLRVQGLAYTQACVLAVPAKVSGLMATLEAEAATRGLAFEVPQPAAGGGGRGAHEENLKFQGWPQNTRARTHAHARADPHACACAPPLARSRQTLLSGRSLHLRASVAACALSIRMCAPCASCPRAAFLGSRA